MHRLWENVRTASAKTYIPWLSEPDRPKILPLAIFHASRGQTDKTGLTMYRLIQIVYSVTRAQFESHNRISLAASESSFTRNWHMEIRDISFASMDRLLA